MRPQLLFYRDMINLCVSSHNTVRHRVHWFWGIPRRNGENLFETESGCCLMAVWLLMTPVVGISSLVLEVPFRSWQPERNTDINNRPSYTV